MGTGGGSGNLITAVANASCAIFETEGMPWCTTKGVGPGPGPGPVVAFRGPSSTWGSATEKPTGWPWPSHEHPIVVKTRGVNNEENVEVCTQDPCISNAFEELDRLLDH